MRKTTGLRDRSAEGRLRVTGPDRASWLQGLVTNDIAVLGEGTGCYAAYLTPQGRMIADLRVLVRGDHLLLDVPAVQTAAVLERMTTFIIMEDVTIADVTESLSRLGLHGPDAAALLASTLDAGEATSLERLAGLAEHANVAGAFRGYPVLIAGSRDVGVPGFDLYLPAETRAELESALAAGGATPIDDEAWETLRIEAGRPLFGVDMSTDTIPLEAGIEDRAISFTKGCYVGQEIIIRVMHRGGGRVAKKLVGLRPATPVDTERVVAESAIHAGDRAIGMVTSAAWSPRLNHWIALGYVHRDFLEPGTGVTIVNGPTPVAATVTALPFDA